MDFKYNSFSNESIKNIYVFTCILCMCIYVYACVYTYVSIYVCVTHKIDNWGNVNVD